MPLLVFVFMGIMELALMFNAYVGVNRASQNGAHLASVLSNQPGTDCFILTGIESDVAPPSSHDSIKWVSVDYTSMAGNVAHLKQKWDRTGSTECTLPDGTTTTVPYTLAAGSDYPEDQRCSVLAGCPGMDLPRSTVDNIGVSVNYEHHWATPLNALYGFFAGGDTKWTFTQRNIFRMEPTL
jgi:hypothetical protein